ncbi:MAG: Hsp70 family protein, partial [Myxococcales bacterium]|nr:Hsp70 family protein [Myxococcales bacterium]
HLGGYSLKGLPKAKAGEVSVDVRFTYDQNGILEVEMTVVGTERKEYLVLEQRPGKMTPEQLAQARAEMESLKFHPRDTLPNRTALDRAEALFVELTGMDRQALGALMARFRGALETQDLALIDEAREALNSAAARMRR